MTKRLVIPLLIVVYLICGARSCSDENPESTYLQKKNAATRDSIKEAFQTDFLSPENIHAFERGARQKLMDFADYFEILNDTSINLEFRDKAAYSIQSLFISNDSKSVIFSEKKSSTIFTLISIGLHNSYPNAKIQIEELEDIAPLERINDSLYSGKLGFKMTLSFKGNPDKANPRNICQNYHISRINKVFGEENLKVWSLKLGDMEEQRRAER